MTDTDLATARSTWCAMDEEQTDVMYRYIALAMQSAGVHDRRQRVAVLAELDKLRAEPLPVPA